jgi:hypothetical protein
VRHNIDTKFHEYPSSHSIVIKYVHKPTPQRRLGCIMFGYVKDAHAQIITISRAINIPPQDF